MDQLTVCRTALSRIGTQSSLSSLDDQSNEANQCATFYASALDAALASIDWRFATRYAPMSLVGTPPPHWAVQYALPSDCLRVRKILNPETFLTSAGSAWGSQGVDDNMLEAIRFERGTGMAADGDVVPVLWSNLRSAWLAYTYRADNPGLWEPGFSEAFTWRLAYDIAIPLTGKSDIQQAMMAGFQESITHAANATGQEATMSCEILSELVTCRGVTWPIQGDFRGGYEWGI